MHRILSCLAAVAVLFAAVPAMAQDDRQERLALAQRAIAAMQTEQIAETMSQMMQALAPPSVQDMPGEVRIAYDETMAEVMASMMARMFDGMEEIYADIYTREELEALVEFYESPVAQSLVSKSGLAAPMIIELTRSLIPEMTRQMINGMCDRLSCTPAEREEALREAMAATGLQES